MALGAPPPHGSFRSSMYLFNNASYPLHFENLVPAIMAFPHMTGHPLLFVFKIFKLKLKSAN